MTICGSQIAALRMVDMDSLAALGHKSASGAAPSAQFDTAPPPTKATAMEDISGTFGRQSVAPETRRQRIRSVFQDIAPRYDLMNDLMSGGMHRQWKARFVKSVESGRGLIVDLAGGTGDIAERISRRIPDTDIVICDPSPAMLGVARARLGDHVGLVTGEGESLPFATSTVATITLSFGLRNMTDPNKAVAEMFRVLKPGGRLHILEFSKPVPWFAPLYGAFSRLVIPALGAAVTRNRAAYRYLVDSIAGFPDPETVSAGLENAGFTNVGFETLLFGVAAMHHGEKPVV